MIITEENRRLMLPDLENPPLWVVEAAERISKLFIPPSTGVKPSQVRKTRRGCLCVKSEATGYKYKDWPL